jgi:hypothetical protein
LYGGKSWGQITKWTKELYDIGKIPQEKYSPGLFNLIYKLVMAIDTIHSLEHNTDSLLIELPEKEKVWMRMALEIVKNSKNFYDVAKLSKDINIIQYFFVDKMLNQNKEGKTIDEIYIDNITEFLNNFINIENNQEYNRLLGQLRNFLRTTNKKYINYFFEAALNFDLDKKTYQYSNFEILFHSLISIDVISAWTSYFLKDINFFKKCIEIYKKIDTLPLFMNMFYIDIKRIAGPINISKDVHKYLLFRDQKYRDLLQQVEKRIIFK